MCVFLSFYCGASLAVTTICNRILNWNLKALDERQCLFELRKLPLFRLELGGMDAAANYAHLHRMLEVQHFVVEQVFDGIAGAGGAVEYAADHDGVVGCVVVTQRPLGHVFAPCQLGAAQHSAEEAEVQGIEDFIEVIKVAFGPAEALAAASSANEFGLPGDGRAGGKSFVAMVMRRVDGLLVELRQQDV